MQTNNKWIRVMGAAALGAGWLGLGVGSHAAHAAEQAPDGQPVVVSGTVPDDTTRTMVLARMKAMYGAGRVVDQLTLGAVVAPPQWSVYVQKLLTESLRRVSHGRLSIQGNTIDIQGEVANEATRQQVVSDLAQALNPSYTVRNGLRVAAQEQSVMDQTLANRIVEFEPGSAVLRPAATPVLDDMAQAMLQLPGKRFEVIGHTDAQGSRAANVALSQSRAQAVKAYLVAKGVAAPAISTLGMGPDQPVASNASEDGRARNRRIEFRVGG